MTVVENSSFAVTSVKPDLGPARLGRSRLPGDPTTMVHGLGETALTGATLSAAVASANAAVPNATVLRAETDAPGATYEVHVKTVGGAYETVKENSSFAVISVQSSVGTPPVGAPAALGAPGVPDPVSSADQQRANPLN